MSAVNQACQAPHYPNVHAIATAIAREDPGQNVAALERRAKACVEPAITWFQRKFNVDLYDLLMAFKTARLFCPVSVQWLRPTDASVESLRAFPFLDSDVTYQTRERVFHQDIQTPRSGLKKRGAAEFF